MDWYALIWWVSLGFVSLLYASLATSLVAHAWFRAKLEYHRQIMRESFNPRRSD